MDPRGRQHIRSPEITEQTQTRRNAHCPSREGGGLLCGPWVGTWDPEADLSQPREVESSINKITDRKQGKGKQGNCKIDKRLTSEFTVLCEILKTTESGSENISISEALSPPLVGKTSLTPR